MDSTRETKDWGFRSFLATSLWSSPAVWRASIRRLISFLYSGICMVFFTDQMLKVNSEYAKTRYQKLIDYYFRNAYILINELAHIHQRLRG